MNYLIFLILITTPLFAKTYKVKVFTEPAAEEKAREFIQNMRNMEPFKQLIEQNVVLIEVSPVEINGINCRGGNYGIPRLAQCDLEKVEIACGDYDLCPVYTSVPDIGAGGPRFPIVSSSFPWTTMLHEVVHTYGFTDEYAYTMSETKTYCPAVADWKNGHSSREETFKTKEKAEAACKKKISWCQKAIDSGAQVVQQIANGKFKIGSPTPASCPNITLGVYSGGSCQAKNPEGTWRPYFCPTVMGYPSLGEEFCVVNRRHKIIRNSPNLIPEFYQEIIFGIIKKATGNQNLSFDNREQPNLTHHAYGIPEIDKLSGHDGETDYCRESRQPSSVKKTKSNPHANCFSHFE